MALVNKHSANSATETATIPRRPGKPKGHPKPPGSGRRPGTPNRATADVKAAARRYTGKAMRTLAKLLDNPDGKVSAIAAREILDRAFGRPTEFRELTGVGGAPLIPEAEIGMQETVGRMLFLIAKARKEREAERIEDDKVVELRPVPEALPIAVEPPAQPEQSDQEQRWADHEAALAARPDQRVGRAMPRVISRRP